MTDLGEISHYLGMEVDIIDNFISIHQTTVRVLDHGRNNEGSMLLYNLAAMKNSKMKMFTEDKSREKQKSPAKTTLIAPELAQKESLSEY